MSSLQRFRSLWRLRLVEQRFRSHHHQQQQQPRRSLSSMAMNLQTADDDGSNNDTSTTTSPPPAVAIDLPYVHSRKKLPPACVDPLELQDRTNHVLQCEVGNLFQFHRQSRDVDRNDRGVAWEVADGTVQMVEYLVRGHAAQIPGTLWQNWTQSPDNNSNDPFTSLETMQALLDRIGNEGAFYMETRKNHLSQLAVDEQLLKKKEKLEDDQILRDWRKFAREDTIVDEDYDDDDDDAEDGMAPGTEEMDNEAYDMLNDFALPGPTVNMYDTFLDGLASAALFVKPSEIASREAAQLLTCKYAFEEIFENRILARHILDGDDEFNDNIHTMPTQISYNAVMRLAANLPYDTTSEVQRDWAFMSAFAAHDAMKHSMVAQNSSTFSYLLQVIAKYMPPCTSRGNISSGIFHMAKDKGVYNGQVQEALLQANEPSNSPECDAWLDKSIRGKDWRTDVPQRWRRRAQYYRKISKQDTY